MAKKSQELQAKTGLALMRLIDSSVPPPVLPPDATYSIKV